MPSYSLTAKQKQKFDALAKSQPTNARGGSDFRAEITDEDGDSITISLRGTVGDSWPSMGPVSFNTGHVRIVGQQRNGQALQWGRCLSTQETR